MDTKEQLLKKIAKRNLNGMIKTHGLEDTKQRVVDYYQKLTFIDTAKSAEYIILEYMVDELFPNKKNKNQI